MFRRIVICLACALLSVMPAYAAASAEEAPVSCLIATAASGEIVVSTQEARERTYLLLPSCADFAALCLRVSEGAALTGTVEGARIEPEDAEWHVWDMGALFGDMAPGKTYPLCVETADGTLEVELMRSAELPSFHIALDATDLPEEYASATAYIHGDKENRLPGQLTVIQLDGSMKEYELSRLKGRGNTSWVASGEKRPYNITLTEKDELIEGAGKAKKWCLLSNNVLSRFADGSYRSDRAGIQNYFVYQLDEAIGGSSALQTDLVDLYLDGAYRGVYMLTEAAEVGSARVDIEKAKNDESKSEEGEVNGEDADDPAIQAGVRAYRYALADEAEEEPGGFLLEIDFYYKDEASWFVTKRGVQFTIKEPELATKEQVQDIAMYVQAFEDALYSESGVNAQGLCYSDYIDMGSWARQYLLDCYVGNVDMFDGSAYFYADLEDDGFGPICRGPAWDYDICFPEGGLLVSKVGASQPGREFGHYNNIWAVQLLTKGDFVAEMSELNRTVFRDALTQANEAVPALTNRLSAAEAMNEALWGNHFDRSAAVWIAGNEAQFERWYGDIWTDDHLNGVTAALSDDGAAIEAHVSGTAESFQWYAVEDDGQLTPVDGADAAAFTPDEDGMYICAAEGANPGFSQYAYEHVDEYTVDGELSLVAQPVIAMYSNAVTWDRPAEDGEAA